MIFTILKNLQKELSIFLISIVIATILIIVSNSWWQTASNDRNMAQADLNEAKERYYTAINRKLLLKEFEKKYKALISSGIVGDEHRLNWVDAIEKITELNKIPYLKYKIDKRQNFNSSALTQSYPGIQLLVSTMTLEMQLLHEGDLYTVLNNLQQEAKGLFNVNSCDIIRNITSIESLIDSQTDKNFSAKCDLSWYTIQQQAVSIDTTGNETYGDDI